jgi:hypothetical protein
MKRVYTNKPLAMSATAIAMLAAAPLAQAAETFGIEARLNREVLLIKDIKPFTERLDLPSLLVLERTAQRARDSLKSNGPAHMETMQSLQELVISTRFSKYLFTQTRTAVTAPKLAEIERIGKELAQATGLDETPYTRITASVYAQVHTLMQQLFKLDLPEGLQTELGSLQAPLGRLIALARQGDHAQTFERARSVQQGITALYPLFDQVAGSDAGFMIVLEIQGLNEYYAEFSKISETPADGGKQP